MVTSIHFVCHQKATEGPKLIKSDNLTGARKFISNAQIHKSSPPTKRKRGTSTECFSDQIPSVAAAPKLTSSIHHSDRNLDCDETSSEWPQSESARLVPLQIEAP